jgi:hypothetical protein
MSDPAVSMRELELEGAELLPSRETLCSPSCGNGGQHGSGFTSIFSQTGYSNNVQSGFINVNALNGDANNWFSIGSGNIL